MNIRKNNGVVGTDIAISILAITLFSGIIISLMFNNAVENFKMRREALSTIYLTEALENVGIEDYDNLTQENIDNGKIDLIPSEVKRANYNMKIEVTKGKQTLSNNVNVTDIKKIKATISYAIGDKEYNHTMERIKIKE